jgi:hypothetical protein
LTARRRTSRSRIDRFVGRNAVRLGGAVAWQSLSAKPGSADRGGYPLLSDFLKQLDAIKVALKHTERLQSSTDNSLVDYRIVRLSMSSPATVVVLGH